MTEIPSRNQMIDQIETLCWWMLEWGHERERKRNAAVFDPRITKTHSSAIEARNKLKEMVDSIYYG